MKHLLLSAALLLSALAAHAQSGNPAVWCPPGATWTYGWGWFAESGIVTLRYDRDTVMAGQSAQILTRSLWAHDGTQPNSPYYTVRMPKVVTRTVGSQVEVLGNAGVFYKLYDFAAQRGSSWITPRVGGTATCPSEVVQVVVDSVGTQLIAGQSRRWFRAHLTSPTGAAVLGGWGGRIYEQLGALGYLQPQSPTCNGTDPGSFGGSFSYRATGQPTVGPNAAGQLLATAAARATAAGFRAYPNPSAGLLTVDLPAGLAPGASLQVLDLTGRVMRQLPASASGQLALRELAAGAYTLLLTAPGQPTLAQRVLVE